MGTGAQARFGSRIPIGLGGLVACAVVVVGFVIHAQAWSFLCDDAFISFRYAVNLAEHGEPVFNVGMDPPQRVEGYTNFAWVVILAIGTSLGVAPHVLALPLCWLGLFAALGLTVVLVRQLRIAAGDPTVTGRLAAIDLAPAALLVSLPEFMVWQSGGLETSFVLALALAAMVAWLGQRWISAAALAAAAGLTRMDALLHLGLFGVSWLIVFVAPRLRHPDPPRIPWRRITPALAAFLAPLVIHLLWRRAYYGAWLPNTWTIKAHGAALRTSNGVPYVVSWMETVGLIYLVPLAALIRPRHIVLLGPAVGVVWYAWWVGGDFMAYGRLLLPATVMVVATIGWLLADVGRLLRSLLLRKVAIAVPLVLLASICGGFAWAAHVRHAADRAKTSGWLAGRWEGVTAMDRFALIRFEVGRWMRDRLPPDTLVTVGAAGALPYASRLPTLDAFGLNDPAIARHPDVEPATGARARPGHQLWAPVSYVRERDPDLLCHVGHHGARRPGRPHPAFSRGYAWACIEAGTVADPRGPEAELDLGFYCCRRPVDRVVGPFGAEGSP